MAKKNSFYPHPILAPHTDDYYNTSSFRAEISTTSSYKSIKFNIKYQLKNPELEKYLYEKKAEFLLHIEAPFTMYRKALPSFKSVQIFELNTDNLKNKVILTPYLVAKKEITNYKNKDFNSDYGNTTFSIEKGTILAIAEPYILTVDNDTSDFSKKQSIFNICKHETMDKSPMEFGLNSDKITIHLNSIDYNKYIFLAGNRVDLLEIINSILLFPALIYALSELADNHSIYENYRWYKSIKNQFKKYNIEDEFEQLSRENATYYAQKLLDLPISNSLSALESLIYLENEEE